VERATVRILNASPISLEKMAVLSLQVQRRGHKDQNSRTFRARKTGEIEPPDGGCACSRRTTALGQNGPERALERQRGWRTVVRYINPASCHLTMPRIRYIDSALSIAPVLISERRAGRVPDPALPAALPQAGVRWLPHRRCWRTGPVKSPRSTAAEAICWQRRPPGCRS
jgi:hypothetical protein